MAAVRRDAYTAGLGHTCGPGCPGRGEAVNDQQAATAYAHHQAALEEGLLRMLASRKTYAAAYRPRWWWLCAVDAEPYRVNPGEFEDPRDFTTSAVQLERWMRESMNRRQVEATGRLRFLARAGLLQRWEELRILTRGGIRAKALTEELARKVSP
jgi:hypothetical protein